MKQLKKLACRTVLDLRMTFPPKTVLSIILGTAITTFGIYNVHRQADITEGGILGLILLFNFWIGMSSSILSPVLDALSYALGFKYLGREFLKTSIFARLQAAVFPGPICLRMLRYLFYPCPTSLHSALCIHSSRSRYHPFSLISFRTMGLIRMMMKTAGNAVQ